MDYAGHPVPVLADHLLDLGSCLIDQLLWPGNDLLNVVECGPPGIDLGQRGLDQTINHAEDRLNSTKDSRRRLGV